MPTDDLVSTTPVIPLAEEAIAMAKVSPMKPAESDTPEPVTVKPEEANYLSSVPMSVVKRTQTSAQAKHWIPKHLNMRVCKWFIPRPKQEDSIDPDCHCNYPKSRHSAKALQNYNKNLSETKWKADSKRTEPQPTNAFGDVDFIGFGQRISKYVRVDHASPMDKVLQLMLEQWHLDPPNLLISVTGGARNFHMQPRLSEVFRRGLMKAASSTGAWIITGGMHAGVMKLVGQAVADWMVAHGSKTKVTAIGIAPWGCINNRECLIDSQPGSPARYRIEKAKKPKHSAIDLNHSHFLFVDNGSQMAYGTEIAFRAQLEKAISSMGTATDGDTIDVPVVCVVVEGGPGTLETVMRALQSGTPAVIVEGSRRAADILAYAYWNSHEIEVDATDNFGKKVKKMVPIFDEDLWKEVRKMIHAEWGDRDIDSRLNWVKECFQYRYNMTIFRLDGGSDTKDIDVAILQALLKANKEQVTDQLKLALAWNRIDVAESDIFTEDKRWEKGELNDAMYMALINERTAFVKLFLENGLSLKDFLNIRIILKLYNEDSMHFSLENVAEVLQDLIGDFYQPLYLRDSRYRNLCVDDILLGRTSRAVSTVSLQYCDASDQLKQLQSLYLREETCVVKGVTKGRYFDAKTGETYVLNDFDNPARELFIWSVLLNRFDIAKVFWEKGKDSIAAALMAQTILRSMASQTDDTELAKDILANMKKFNELSTGVLSECYSGDERRAGLLLVKQQNNFGLSTMLQLAVSADDKLFISHAACQSLLTNIWRGRMTLDVGIWRIWACIFFPPLIYLLITFRGDEREELVRHSSRFKKSKTNATGEHEDRARMNRLSILSGDSQQPLIEEPSQSRKRFATCIEKFIYFYNAPLITFIHNCLFYIVFLLLYSYVILTNFHPQVSVQEIILIFWVFTLLTEEIRQVLMDEAFSLKLKLQNYISDVWNLLDLLTLITFIVGVILRFIPNANCFEAARIILALNVMTFSFRLLHIFSVGKELGPKLVMIGRMMIDLIQFVIILTVFILSYGVASQAILYPNSPLAWDLVKDVIYKPYWQMYGELFLEEITGAQDCTNNVTEYSRPGGLSRCVADNTVVPILLGIYILITNILMLNLLIAMFSYTFNLVQEETDQFWCFERMSLVREYASRPPLPPPLIILSHIYYLIKALCSTCCTMAPAQSEDFKMILNEDENHQLTLWENLNQEEYVRNTNADELAKLENQVSSTHDSVSSIVVKLDEVMESNFMLGSHSASSSSASHQAKLPPALDERLVYLEEQMKRTSQALDWIIKSMVEKGSGSKSGPPELTDIEKMKLEAQKKRQALEEKEKEQFKEMLKRQLDLHVKSRTKYYPSEGETILRFPVPDDKVHWDQAWSEYDPVVHTDDTILAGPSWADVDLLTLTPDERNMLRFNELDEESGVDRRSFCGTYQVIKGLPINPKGRTGLVGRGLLGRWGPNHAGDPIVTRWAKDIRGEPLRQDNMPVLEFVAIHRQDAKQWAIPGGLLQLGQSVEKALKAEFTEEALGNLPDPSHRDSVRQQVNTLFQSGVEVYSGYSDDPRNTDNAWVETTAVNYHDENGCLTHLTLRAGGSADMVRWMKISTAESLYAAHIAILQKVASKHNAAF